MLTLIICGGCVFMWWDALKHYQATGFKFFIVAATFWLFLATFIALEAIVHA